MDRDRTYNTLGELLAGPAEMAEDDIERWLVEPGTPDTLAEAMRYCVLGGGKRLRPALVYFAAEACGDGQADGNENARRAAVALELTHGYSLVHDDLPAMDDDTLRRGQPTAHVKFGEAMAILAGDALLTRAFALLAETDGTLAGKLAAELALGAGPTGMIAGQVADMDLCEIPAGIDGLGYIHARKTGALIRAAGRMGAICGGASDAALAAETGYTEKLGLAFQMVDDLLDVTASAEQLGKTPGKDQQAGKRTHVAEMGVEASAELARKITNEALEEIRALGDSARRLAMLGEFLAERTY